MSSPAGNGVPDRDSEANREQLAGTRVVLRPLASPLPLGLYAFAVGSVVLSVGQLGAFTQAEMRTVAYLLATFVAVPQLLAAVIAFLTREAVVATLLGLVGMTWPMNLVVMVLSPEMTSAPRGVLYLAVGTVLVLMGAAALSARPLIGVLVLVAAARYVTGGVYDVTTIGAWQTASAVAGLGVTALAGYLGLALALEDTRHRTVLPTGRRGAAARAFNGDLRTQIASLPNEAGVRNQL